MSPQASSDSVVGLSMHAEGLTITLFFRILKVLLHCLDSELDIGLMACADAHFGKGSMPNELAGCVVRFKSTASLWARRAQSKSIHRPWPCACISCLHP